MKAFGWLLIVAGTVATLFFFFLFDTGVAVPGGFGVFSRVNNLGLMGDRQSGILISLAALIIGVLLVLFAQKKSPPPLAPGDGEPVNYQATLPEFAKREPVSEKRLRAILEKQKAPK